MVLNIYTFYTNCNLKNVQYFLNFTNCKCQCYRHIVQKSDSEIWTIVCVQSVLFKDCINIIIFVDLLVFF